MISAQSVAAMPRDYSDPAAVIYKGSGYYCTDNPHGNGCNCSQCKGGN